MWLVLFFENVLHILYRSWEFCESIQILIEKRSAFLAIPSSNGIIYSLMYEITKNGNNRNANYLIQSLFAFVGDVSIKIT